MSAEQKTPADIARGLAKRARTQAASSESAWRRETYTLERGAGQSARLFREVPESGLHDGNRILARTLRRPHRIHDQAFAQRRLIA
jgi:hypothetical protein